MSKETRTLQTRYEYSYYLMCVAICATFERSGREKTMTFLLSQTKQSKKTDIRHDDSSCLFSVRFDHVVSFDVTFQRSEREKTKNRKSIYANKTP